MKRKVQRNPESSQESLNSNSVNGPDQDDLAGMSPTTRPHSRDIPIINNDDSMIQRTENVIMTRRRSSLLRLEEVSKDASGSHSDVVLGNGANTQHQQSIALENGKSTLGKRSSENDLRSTLETEPESLAESKTIKVKKCKHAASIRISRFKKYLAKTPSKSLLESKNPSALKDQWLCLACAQSHHFSPSETANQNAGLEHFLESQQHPLAIHLFDFDIWCFACRRIINSSSSNNQLLLEISVEVKKWLGTQMTATAPILAIKSPSKQKGKLKAPYPGLSNLGNTCFFNSVMQCLTYTQHLQSVIHIPPEQLSSCGPLTRAFSFFLKNMHTGTPSTISPRELFSQICGKWKIYSGFQQQDSHELLRRLLDELREEFKRFGKKDTQSDQPMDGSIVDEVFLGKLTSLIVCDECGYISCSFEDFLDLSLPIAQPTKPKAGIAHIKAKLNKKKLKTKQSIDIEASGSESGLSADEKANSTMNSTTSLHSQEPSFQIRSSTESFPNQHPLTHLFDDIEIKSRPEFSLDQPLGKSTSLGSSLSKLSDISKPAPLKIPLCPGMHQLWIDRLFRNVPPSAYPSKLHLEKCLKAFMAVECLEGENAWTCEKCAIRLHERNKQMAAEKKPENIETNVMNVVLGSDSDHSDHLQEAVSPATMSPDPFRRDYSSAEDDLEKQEQDLSVSIISSELNAVDLNDDKDYALSGTATSLNIAKMELSDCMSIASENQRETISSQPASPPKLIEKQETIKPVLRSARKRYLIYKLPKVLVLNLKRFQQSHGMLGGRRMMKIGDIVDFDETLHLDDVLADESIIDSILALNKKSEKKTQKKVVLPNMEELQNVFDEESPLTPLSSLNSIADFDMKRQETQYRLYGVVVHSGSLFGGHYISYVRIPRKTESSDEEYDWVHFSDSHVRMSSWDEVAKCQAYMLFFERK